MKRGPTFPRRSVLRGAIPPMRARLRDIDVLSGADQPVNNDRLPADDEVLGFLPVEERADTQNRVDF